MPSPSDTPSAEERLARALFAENCDDEWEDCDEATRGEFRRDARDRLEWIASVGLALYDPATHVAVSRDAVADAYHLGMRDGMVVGGTDA